MNREYLQSTLFQYYFQKIIGFFRIKVLIFKIEFVGEYFISFYSNKKILIEL